MELKSPVLIPAHVGLCLSQDPVNQELSVWAGHPTPDIACLVGFHSIESKNIWRANCSEAHNYRLNISNTLWKTLKWPKEKKFIQ